MWVGTTSFNKDMLFVPAEEFDTTQKPSTATRSVEGWYICVHQPFGSLTLIMVAVINH